MIFDAAKFISQVPLFADLPKDELSRLASRFQQKTIEKGEHVYSEGEKAHVTWIVRSGRIKITKAAFDGKPLTLEMIMPGEIFGCVGCLDNGFYPCEASAAATSTVWGLPTMDFLALLEKYPRFARNVYLEMGQRAREAQKWRTLGLETVERRVAGVLIWLRGKFGDALPFTRQAVAEMASTTPESTIRTLIDFRKKGWIRTAWKKIILQKPEELKKLVE